MNADERACVAEGVLESLVTWLRNHHNENPDLTAADYAARLRNEHTVILEKPKGMSDADFSSMVESVIRIASTD